MVFVMEYCPRGSVLNLLEEPENHHGLQDIDIITLIANIGMSPSNTHVRYSTSHGTSLYYIGTIKLIDRHTYIDLTLILPITQILYKYQQRTQLIDIIHVTVVNNSIQYLI
jgi:hypothetical protein